MTDSSFTLLEVHLGDGDIELGPFELFTSADDPAEVAELETEADETDAESDGGFPVRSVAGLLLALAALAAVAIGVKKLRGGDEVPSVATDDDVSSGIAGDDEVPSGIADD